jgi:hypothetical protein
VKLIAIALTLVSVKGPIFATVGDSVASFLTDRDQTTVSQCLVGKEDLNKGSKDLLDEDLTERTTREQNAIGFGWVKTCEMGAPTDGTEDQLQHGGPHAFAYKWALTRTNNCINDGRC